MMMMSSFIQCELQSSDALVRLVSQSYWLSRVQTRRYGCVSLVTDSE